MLGAKTSTRSVFVRTSAIWLLQKQQPEMWAISLVPKQEIAIKDCKSVELSQSGFDGRETAVGRAFRLKILCADRFMRDTLMRYELPLLHRDLY